MGPTFHNEDNFSAYSILVTCGTDGSGSNVFNFDL